VQRLDRVTGEPFPASIILERIESLVK
jgi:hypothetical protein